MWRINRNLIRDLFNSRRAVLLFLLPVVLLLASGSVMTVEALHYDTDRDQFIEIESAEQLLVVELDLYGDGLPQDEDDRANYLKVFPGAEEGMCDSQCLGYELMNNIDLNYNGSDPVIGAYAGDFDGNGFEISNVTVSSNSVPKLGGLFSTLSGDVHDLYLVDVNVTSLSSSSAGGLVGTLNSAGTISNVVITSTVHSANNVGGLVGVSSGAISNSFAYSDVASTSLDSAGGLVGWSKSGSTISNSFAYGNVTAQTNYAGGLVGYSDANIINSFAFGNVTAKDTQAGGLVGYSNGDITTSSAFGNVTAKNDYAGGLVGLLSTNTVLASYAFGNVSSPNGVAAGLVGECGSGGKIEASYAVVTVDGHTEDGLGADCTIENSYWNTDASPDISTDDNGKNSAELKAPTGYGTGTDIYANWNVTGTDAPAETGPWSFGTLDTYPTLYWQDHDLDNNGLVDVYTPEQLEAIKWDLNGDGASKHFDYFTAFPYATIHPCPNDTCMGYELMADLDYTGFSSINGTYTGIFDGNHHTIANVTSDGGLFYILDGDVRNLNLVNVNTVATSGDSVGALANELVEGSVTNVHVINSTIDSVVSQTGGLVGFSDRANIHNSHFSGDISSSGDNTGGLVGSTGGSIIASHFSGDISSSGDNTGGLVGIIGNGPIIASYSAGTIRVTGGENVAGGGLIGQCFDAVPIKASYTVTSVYGDGTLGGLIGVQDSLCDDLTDSYWVNDVPSDVSTFDADYAKSSTEMKTPTGYGTGTDIYANWNVTGTDAPAETGPWLFGTSEHLPYLYWQSKPNLAPTIDNIVLDDVYLSGTERTIPVTVTDYDDEADSLMLTMTPNLSTYGITIDSATSQIIISADSTAGEYPATVTVTDTHGITATSDQFIIIINDAPVLGDVIVDGMYTSGVEFTILISAVDADDTLEYSMDSTLSPADGTIEINSTTGTITGNITTVGTYTIIVNVTDSYNIMDTTSFDIVIGAPLELTITPIADISDHVKGTLFSYQVTVSNSDGTPTYTLTTSPTGSQIDSATGEITWNNPIVGTHPFTIQVTDDSTSIATESFTLVVIDDDTTPPPTPSGLTIDSIDNISGHMEDTLFSYKVTVSNAVGDLVYVSTLTTSPTGSQIDSATGEITWNNPIVGTHPFTIQVTDDSTSIATESFTLVVIDDDTTPPPTPSGLTIDSIDNISGHMEDTLFSYKVTVSNAVGDLVYTLTTSPTGSQIDSATGEITWNNPIVGTHPFTIQVTDDSTSIATESFTLVVIDDDTTPPPTPSGLTIDSIDNISGHMEDTLFSYKVTVSNAVGDLVYTLTTSPTGSQIDSATGEITWNNPIVGTHPFTIQVTDDSTSIATESFTLEVISATPPTTPELTITPIADISDHVKGTLFSYQVTVSNAVGDLVYTLTTSPTGSQIDSATGEITWNNPIVGTHPFTIQVTDDSTSIATESFTLVVIDDDTTAPPVDDNSITITSTLHTTGMVGTPFEYQIMVDNPANNPLDYTYTTSTDDIVMNDTGYVTWATPMVGIHSFNVTVTDDTTGTTITGSFTLTITLHESITATCR